MATISEMKVRGNNREIMDKQARKNIINLARPIRMLSESAAVKASYNALEFLCLQFESEEDEAEFWNGSHTYGQITTETRNIGLSLTDNSGAHLGFYWLMDNLSYIGSDEAFSLTKNMNVIGADGNVQYIKFDTTLDDYNVTIYAVVNWDETTNTTSTMGSVFQKEMNQYYRTFIEQLPFFENEEHNGPLILLSGSQAAKDTCEAVMGLYFEFEDTDDETEFWSGNHTYQSITAKRNIGAVRIDANQEINFYWINNSSFIAGDWAFSIFPTDKVENKIGSIYVQRKSVTLDGYRIVVHSIIDWSKIATSQTSNFITKYNTTKLYSQKLLFANGSAGENRLTEINFGVDGDSITVGNQWSYYVYQQLGFATHHNVGVGSSQFQDEIETYNGENYYPQIYGETGWLGMSDGWGEITSAEEAQKRANNSAKNHVLKFIDEVTQGLYPAPGIFVFAMGTNDDVTRLGTVDEAFASATLPDVDDTSLRKTTVAMRWCIQKIHQTYPDCKIYWSNMIQSSTDSRQTANETKLPVMTEVARRLSCEIIDQWGGSGISALMEKASAYFLRDGTHPTEKGQKAMADFACSVLANYYKIS